MPISLPTCTDKERAVYGSHCLLGPKIIPYGHVSGVERQIESQGGIMTLCTVLVSDQYRIVVGEKEQATESLMYGQIGGGRVTELRLYTKFNVTRGRRPGFNRKAHGHSDSVPGMESQDG